MGPGSRSLRSLGRDDAVERLALARRAWTNRAAGSAQPLGPTADCRLPTAASVPVSPPLPYPWPRSFRGNAGHDGGRAERRRRLRPVPRKAGPGTPRPGVPPRPLRAGRDGRFTRTPRSPLGEAGGSGTGAAQNRRTGGREAACYLLTSDPTAARLPTFRWAFFDNGQTVGAGRGDEDDRPAEGRKPDLPRRVAKRSAQSRTSRPDGAPPRRASREAAVRPVSENNPAIPASPA